MKKKIVSLVLSMVMTTALLAGCGSVEDSGKDSEKRAGKGFPRTASSGEK